MSDVREGSPERHDGFGAFSIDDARRMRWSPLNDSVWKRVLRAAGVSLVIWALHFVLGDAGTAGIWITAVALLVGWAMAVELVLRDSSGRRFWLVCLGAGFVAMLFAPGSWGLVTALSLSSVFLVFRRYRPYRHLTSARRAMTAGLALLSFLVLQFAIPEAGDHSGGAAVGVAWAQYAGASFVIFWALTLLKLIFGMRLHFLRLKLKLAVCAFFLGTVPFVLVVVISIVSLAGVIGSGRAVQAEQIVERWLREILVLSDTEYHPLDPGFTWSSSGDVTDGDVPVWIRELEAAYLVPLEVVRAEADSARAAWRARRDSMPDDEDEIIIGYGASGNDFSDFWTPSSDTIGVFMAGGQLWALRILESAESGLLVRGCQLDSTVLDRLAGEVNVEVGIVGVSQPDPWLVESGEFRSGRAGTSNVHVQSTRFQVAETDSTEDDLWHRSVHIGAVVVPITQLVSERLIEDQVVLYVQTNLLGFGKLFFANTGQADDLLLVVLAVLGFMFVVGTVFAMLFGLRITGGITSAVARLDKGTRRLANGDFDTRIDLPNEDELGDLALSFNEMASKVERGREEAVARERLEREMNTAREIQERLLPDGGPAVPGFDVTGVSIPSLQVGGDYYDFLSAGEGRHGIAIGDVSGKGVPAALLMSNLQASLAGQVIHPSSVAEVVSRVNDLIARATEPHMFATFFYGVLDCRQFSFTSCNAGHNPPMLVRADGAVEFLGKGGLLVGMMTGQLYEQETVELAPGDMIVLYTDGVTEAVGPDAEGRVPLNEEEEDVDAMFGEDALQAVVAANRTRPASGVKEAILAAVARHTAGVDQSDDITLVVIKRHEQ